MILVNLGIYNMLKSKYTTSISYFRKPPPVICVINLFLYLEWPNGRPREFPAKPR